MKKNLLVFGGSGFIGQEICKIALEQGMQVVSISKNGEPRKLISGLVNSEISWVASNVLADSDWKDFVSHAFCVINLIGILKESAPKRLTYAQHIIEANERIAEEVEKHPHITYIFLSANAGGPFVQKGYIISKHIAEKRLSHLQNPVIIFRPGLVVSVRRPLSLIVGSGILLLSLVPVTRATFKEIVPVFVNTLARRIVTESKSQDSNIITPQDMGIFQKNEMPKTF